MARVMQELTIEEAAARSGYSRPYLSQLLAEGKLRGRKIDMLCVLDSA
jgi:transcriptional regulator with XRE-family HTH domain